MGMREVEEADKARSRMEESAMSASNETGPFQGACLLRAQQEDKLSRNTRGQAHHFASLAALCLQKVGGKNAPAREGRRGAE